MSFHRQLQNTKGYAQHRAAQYLRTLIRSRLTFDEIYGKGSQFPNLTKEEVRELYDILIPNGPKSAADQFNDDFNFFPD